MEITAPCCPLFANDLFSRNQSSRRTGARCRSEPLLRCVSAPAPPRWNCFQMMEHSAGARPARAHSRTHPTAARRTKPNREHNYADSSGRPSRERERKISARSGEIRFYLFHFRSDLRIARLRTQITYGRANGSKRISQLFHRYAAAGARECVYFIRKFHFAPSLRRASRHTMYVRIHFRRSRVPFYFRYIFSFAPRSRQNFISGFVCPECSLKRRNPDGRPTLGGAALNHRCRRSQNARPARREQMNAGPPSRSRNAWRGEKSAANRRQQEKRYHRPRQRVLAEVHIR